MTETDVAEWLYERVGSGLPVDADMGRIEKAVEAASLAFRREAIERLVQRGADACAAECPDCGGRLRAHVRRRARRVLTRCGLIRFTRDYGRCPVCGHYAYPADAALGLHGRASPSPIVQEICALEALSAPAARKARDVLRLTGLDIDPSVMHREARRQGEAARALRDRDAALAQTPAGVATLAAAAIRGLPDRPFTLVIEIDAWNIRERDAWGQTAKLLAKGEKPERWHWVYTGTVFRLDQRGTTAAGRPVITERGYVATRKGLDALRLQVYAEALRRGLLQAERVLILADGAIWIWELATDRFKGATQRVDLHHVQEHLWTLAADLHGKGTEAASEWVAPYLAWLTRRKDGGLDVLHGLESLLTPPNRSRPSSTPRCSAKSAISTPTKTAWTTRTPSNSGSLSAPGRSNQPARSTSAGSNSLASSGASRATRLSSRSKPSIAMKGGTCSSRTTATRTLGMPNRCSSA